MYDCSYCDDLARYVGKGQDGDFYCNVHKYRAPGEVESVNEGWITRSQLKTDTLYFVEDTESYAVSPDGTGLFWYDSEEEAESQHGTLPLVSVANITDF